jgi:ATPase subunit of ABC transporter with duplicated ATPase domains
VPAIDLSGVSYAHTDSVPLITEATLRLLPGWTGVVGANGAGKTTLLDLLRGALAPDAGRVAWNPKSLSIHLCPQTVERIEPPIEELARARSGEAQRLRAWLALRPEQLARWETLSPGERKRWQVGAALALAPDALLLDEPTNHLDANARDGLLGALAVSHDRTLLERLTEHTLRIHRGRVASYRGSYEQARESWEALEREELASHAKLARERKKQRKRLGDKRRARAKAEVGQRTSRKMKNAKDSDTRLRFKQKRRRSAEVSLGRDVQLTRRKIGRLDEAIEGFQLEKKLGRSIFVSYETAPVPHLLLFEAAELKGGERTLVRDLRLEVGRESRIHLAGANGTGKTTLLNALVRHARIPASRVLYLPLELSAAEGRTLLDEARALEAEVRGRLMNIVAALGVDPGSLLESHDPSPGEARKLALALGLAREVWLLVLDEPTNHLDLPSISQLEEALCAYPGALLMVTHDDALAARVATERWLLEECALRVERTGKPVGC